MRPIKGNCADDGNDAVDVTHGAPFLLIGRICPGCPLAPEARRCGRSRCGLTCGQSSRLGRYPFVALAGVPVTPLGRELPAGRPTATDRSCHALLVALSTRCRTSDLPKAGIQREGRTDAQPDVWPCSTASVSPTIQSSFPAPKQLPTERTCWGHFAVKRLTQS
jgi:hypothetical protein